MIQRMTATYLVNLAGDNDRVIGGARPAPPKDGGAKALGER